MYILIWNKHGDICLAGKNFLNKCSLECEFYGSDAEADVMQDLESNIDVSSENAKEVL